MKTTPEPICIPMKKASLQRFEAVQMVQSLLLETDSEAAERNAALLIETYDLKEEEIMLKWFRGLFNRKPRRFKTEAEWLAFETR